MAAALRIALGVLSAMLVTFALTGWWRGPSRQVHLEIGLQPTPLVLGQPSLQLEFPGLGRTFYHDSPQEGQETRRDSALHCQFQPRAVILEIEFRSWAKPRSCTVAISRPGYITRRLRAVELNEALQGGASEQEPLRSRQLTD